MTKPNFLQAALVLATLLTAGCATPASTATLHTAETTNKRKLLATDATPSVLRSWALSFSQDWKVEKFKWAVKHHYDDSGRYRHRHDYKVWETPYWVATDSFDGDGVLTYLGNKRYAYKVPAGLFLKVTRATGRVWIGGKRVNGMNATTEWVAGESFELLYGPGQFVQITMENDTHLFGYTADVAMLGLGPTPGTGSAVGEAPAAK